MRARVPVARLAFKGSGESRKCPILQIITCKACALILDWIWHVFNTHTLSQGKRRRLADDRLTFSLFNDALLIPAVNTHSPKHPHTQIYIVSVPCRTSYGLYRATCFLHVCQLLLRHLQAAQEQKSRADVTHKLTTCWWMIVKSSLTAAVLHKETRLSLSKNTDKHVHAYCSSAAETPFLSLFFTRSVFAEQCFVYTCTDQSRTCV